MSKHLVLVKRTWLRRWLYECLLCRPKIVTLHPTFANASKAGDAARRHLCSHHPEALVS